MLYDPSTASHLKPWLVRTLEPICDAEPGALADYILALLRHNGPEAELRQELISQLEEFLEKETMSFIDTLFISLRSKSYLPYSASSPPPTAPAALASSGQSAEGGIPIPLDSLLNPADTSPLDTRRKRGLENDDRDRPSKGPRLNDSGNFSRYGRGDRGSWGGRGDNGSRMMIPGRPDYMDGGTVMDGGMGRGYRPQERRGICRDYHNTGYCARGAFCKYSHGEDAIIPNQLFPMAGPAGFMGGMGILPNGTPMPFPMAGGVNATYDPHERMDMRPMRGGPMGMVGRGGGRPQIMSRDGMMNGMRKHGELPVIQDLTPQVPQEEMSMPNGSGVGLGPGPMAGVMPTYQNDALTAGIARDIDMASASSANMRTRGSGSNTHHIPRRTGDKTLVVEKIPSDKLSISAINDWFKRFGTVTNVAVDARGGKALVSFAEHDMAYKAWKGEEAVFGNRFVKVFWHRPVEGKGEMGAKMLQQSGDLMAKVAAREQHHHQKPAASEAGPSSSASTSSVRKPSTATSSAAAALAAKQQLLEQQITEQKELMSKLVSASTPAEKKEIMARLRKLNEEMKPLSTPTTPPVTKTPGTSTPLKSEEAEKERLDKELELHGAIGVGDETVTGAGEGEESTDELKARLAKLKAEAASLGLTDPSESQPYYGGGYRGYRGRGRGARSYYRGGAAMRGGPPRGSMKLDNRPKKLLVKGVRPDEVEKVREWYETALVGQVEGVEMIEGSATDAGGEGDGGMVIAFRSRAAAEQGLSKGTKVANLEKSLQISWYTGQTSTSTPTHPKPTTVNGATRTTDTEDKDAPMDGSKESRVEENHSADVDEDSHMGGAHEEEVAGGWGAEEGDDGFGMI